MHYISALHVNSSPINILIHQYGKYFDRIFFTKSLVQILPYICLMIFCIDIKWIQMVVKFFKWY